MHNLVSRELAFYPRAFAALQICLVTPRGTSDPPNTQIQWPRWRLQRSAEIHENEHTPFHPHPSALSLTSPSRPPPFRRLSPPQIRGPLVSRAASSCSMFTRRTDSVEEKETEARLLHLCLQSVSLPFCFSPQLWKSLLSLSPSPSPVRLVTGGVWDGGGDRLHILWWAAGVNIVRIIWTRTRVCLWEREIPVSLLCHLEKPNMPGWSTVIGQIIGDMWKVKASVPGIPTANTPSAGWRGTVPEKRFDGGNSQFDFAHSVQQSGKWAGLCSRAPAWVFIYSGFMDLKTTAHWRGRLINLKARHLQILHIIFYLKKGSKSICLWF